MDLGNIFILGDSYSTFEGYVPEGYGSYYKDVIENVTDVSEVEQTWWHRLAAEHGGNIVRNCSWSGTTICNTGYGGYCPDSSFVGRFDRLVESGFFLENKIDTILIFGGTNDAWAESPVGEVKYADWTEDDLRKALPAFCYLLHRVKECVPEARLVNILNDVVVKAELTDGYREACIHMGVKYAEAGDFGRENGHPNIQGMAEIAERVAAAMEE
ncbi:MAG: hypothetical protein IJ386_00945 [Clostridia bacterium]|nr:hypothetical protein [Clostridia bacterium]